MAVTINGSAGVTTNSGAVYNGISSGTAVASTSGTSIDFTGIPSWVKRITISYSGLSKSGSSIVQIQIGDSGGVENTGYLGGGSTSTTQSTLTTGFYVGMSAATDLANGSWVINLIDASSNLWAGMGLACLSNVAQLNLGSGSKSLSATLDRIRITTVNGTDTFDAGTINILYE